MKNETIQSCCMAAFLFLGMQSLSDVARKETERRRLVDLQGVEVKVIEIDSGQRAVDGNQTQRKVPSAASIKDSSYSSNASKDKGSALNYRSVLQKLDKAILQEERRLEAKRERLQSVRRAPIRISSRIDSNQTSNNLLRLQSEIEDIEEKLKQLREERMEKYEEGIKAGFLPGELDGRGIMP
jgi:hypothetical protein